MVTVDLVRPRVYTAAVTNTSQGATVLELTPYRGEQ